MSAVLSRRRPACHPDRRHRARLRCTACYERARAHGIHIDHPRLTRSDADFVADYRVWVSEGHPRWRIAVRRARRAGLLSAGHAQAAGEAHVRAKTGGAR